MLFASLLPLLSTINTFAAVPAGCNKGTFALLIPWYQYLTLSDPPACAAKIDSSHVLGSNSFLLLIGLAVLDDLIRIAALVAVGYVVYGGIQYITSQGSPDATSKAQQTIINALIGVVLAILAAAIVQFIGTQIGG